MRNLLVDLPLAYLRWLREHLEEQGWLLLVAENPEVGLRFLRGLLGGILVSEWGYLIGPPEAPLEGLGVQVLHWGDEAPLTGLLRAVARQDPDHVSVAQLSPQALEFYGELMLTGHSLGSLAWAPASHRDSFLEASGCPLHVMTGAACMELDPQGELVRLSRCDGQSWETLVERRMADFDLERDPLRTADFQARRYEEWGPMQRDRPIREVVLHPGGSRPGWIAQASARVNPSDLALCSQPPSGFDWPRWDDHPGLLLLQLSPQRLQSLLPGTRQWLQLFFPSRPESSRPGFALRWSESPLGSGEWLREGHAIEEWLPILDGPLESESHHSHSKLGGYPTWLQADETPACPQCGQEMTFVFQFCAHQLADAGIGGDFHDYLFVCPQHPHQSAMVHQC